MTSDKRINEGTEKAISALEIFQEGFLTEKQLECLKLRAQYKSLQEIGDGLGITKQGVDDNIKKAYKKIKHYCQKIGVI
jgi:predicted DNA-binding protein YlxM (UPF0122 family)